MKDFFNFIEKYKFSICVLYVIVITIVVIRMCMYDRIIKENELYVTNKFTNYCYVTWIPYNFNKCESVSFKINNFINLKTKEKHLKKQFYSNSKRDVDFLKTDRNLLDTTLLRMGIYHIPHDAFNNFY